MGVFMKQNIHGEIQVFPNNVVLLLQEMTPFQMKGRIRDLKKLYVDVERNPRNEVYEGIKNLERELEPFVREGRLEDVMRDRIAVCYQNENNDMERWELI